MEATKTRALKERVPAEIMKDLKARSKKYGAIRKLAIAAGIEYANFALIVSTGEATPANIKKVEKALKTA